MEEELKQNTQQPKDGQSASPKHMSKDTCRQAKELAKAMADRLKADR